MSVRASPAARGVEKIRRDGAMHASRPKPVGLAWDIFLVRKLGFAVKET